MVTKQRERGLARANEGRVGGGEDGGGGGFEVEGLGDEQDGEGHGEVAGVGEQVGGAQEGQGGPESGGGEEEEEEGGREQQDRHWRGVGAGWEPVVLGLSLQSALRVVTARSSRRRKRRRRRHGVLAGNQELWRLGFVLVGLV